MVRGGIAQIVYDELRRQWQDRTTDSLSYYPPAAFIPTVLNFARDVSVESHIEVYVQVRFYTGRVWTVIAI